MNTTVDSASKGFEAIARSSSGPAFLAISSSIFAPFLVRTPTSSQLSSGSIGGSIRLRNLGHQLGQSGGRNSHQSPPKNVLSVTNRSTRHPRGIKKLSRSLWSPSGGLV